MVVLVVSFAGLCLCAAHYGTLKYGYDWPQAEVGPVRIAYGFTMGVVICRLYKVKPFMVRIPWWLLIAAAVAIFFFRAPWGAPAWEVFAVSILVPAIVMAAVVNEPPKALQGACATAGLLSYVVYSLHEPFIGLFLRGQDRLHLDLNAQTPTDSVIFTMLLIALWPRRASLLRQAGPAAAHPAHAGRAGGETHPARLKQPVGLGCQGSTP